MAKMMWWVAIPVGIGALIAALTKGSKQSTAGINYTVGDWLPYIKPLAEAGRISVPFIAGWLGAESGGNPCAWGKATAKGPDGHPREQGIGQLYNPDDMTRYGVPSGAFRVYCVPGTQQCSRALTQEEMVAQAKALVDLALHCREIAGAASAKNGLRWNGKDMLKLTKLVHGLPGLVSQGVARVTTKLGYPPRGWWEFKAGVDLVKMDEGTEKYRADYPRLFANAEKTVANVPDDVKVVS